MTTDEKEFTGAEIIDFASILKGVSVEPQMQIKRSKSGCIACRFEFDQHERSIECPVCHRKWEAFDALMHLATHWRTFVQNRTHLRHEVTKLSEERDRLHKEVANLRAAKRRADEIVTALVKALKDRERDMRFRDPKSTFADGARAALRNVIEFIKSDVWRPTNNGGTAS